MSRLALLFVMALSASSFASTEDILLRKAIAAYRIEPLQAPRVVMGPKEKLGQALFFDPFVSGPKAISCATCHVRSLGAADGNPMAVGLGARGTGEERLQHSSAFVVPRNALPFFNRGSSSFRALFWDGRVQIGPNGSIETPLGKRMPRGFDSLLATAAVFPLAEPDEMLGRELKRSTKSTFHHELVGAEVDAHNMEERTLSVFRNLLGRLLGRTEADGPTTQQYRDLFSSAYPDVALKDVGVHHVGNALAAYITAAFALQPAAWDKYVAGDGKAISAEQKRGAILFLGKGRCFVCHSGIEFSDFKFHGLAIPQFRVGKHSAHLDYGRAGATSRGEDRFKFRTAPLRNVAVTGPWGHNGSFKTLKSIVEHHLNPIPALYAAQQSQPSEARHSGRLLGSRSPILAEIAPLESVEVELLLAFLSALTSPTVMSDAVAVPANVPSGNKEFIRR